MTSGTCQILNGGCGELCVPEKNGRICECDVGLQLQPDQSCDSGGHSSFIINLYSVYISQKYGKVYHDVIMLQKGRQFS